MHEEQRRFVLLNKRIDDFSRKIDTGIIELKVKILNYLEEPLFDYLKDTKIMVDNLYNEMRLYCYSYYDTFNPRYMTDAEMINRYAVSKVLELKSKDLMDKTNSMIEFENKRRNNVMSNVDI